MNNESFLKLLVCPVDKQCLVQIDSYLVCNQGHKYPIVNSIPVILLPNVDQTLWVSKKSWEVANDFVEKKDINDHFFIDTLGLSVNEIETLKKSICNKASAEKTQTIIAYLLGATCGNLYKGMSVDFTKLPIPNFPISATSGILLDIGCNWGRWSISASKKGLSVIGIDPSLGALIVAKELCAYQGIDAKFICADSRYLPFASETFDFVFSYSVLQHFSKRDVIVALKDINRVLKIKGSSFIQMANSFGVCSFYYQLKRKFRKPVDFEVRYWKPAELKKTFSLNIGPSKIHADCFLGLGIQYDNNIQFLSPAKKIIASCSKMLKRLEQRIPSLSLFADSLYVESTKSY